jgi:hypothetical protein
VASPSSGSSATSSSSSAIPVSNPMVTGSPRASLMWAGFGSVPEDPSGAVNAGASPPNLVAAQDEATNMRAGEIVQILVKHLGILFSGIGSDISKNVLEPLETHKERFSIVCKNAQSEIAKMMKEYRELMAKVGKAKVRYHKVRDELCELEMLIDESSDGGLLEAHQNKAILKQSEIVNVRDEYVKSIKQARTFKIQADRKISKLVDYIDNLERERVDLIRTGYSKFLGAQISIWKSLHDEFAASSAVIDSEFALLRTAVYSNRVYISAAESLLKSPMPEFEEYKRTAGRKKNKTKDFRILTANEIEFTESKDSNASSPPSAQELAVKEFHDQWEQWFNHQFDCLGSYQECICSEPIDNVTMISTLGEGASRTAFSKALATHRNHNSGAIESEEALENITDAMRICLDAVHLEGSSFIQSSPRVNRAPRDITPAREVMIVSQTIFDATKGKSAARNKKEFVAGLLRKHQLFQSEKFWDELYFAGIEAEKQSKRAFEVREWMADEEIEEMKATNNNVIFGQLVNISHSMLLFGNTAEDTRKFVDRNSKVNRLPDELCAAIFAQIDDSKVE